MEKTTMNEEKNHLKCYTIGHSNSDIQSFVGLLNKFKINCLIDVRSIPYRQYSAQFNREQLKLKLNDSSIDYLYFGDTLGGKVTNYPEINKDSIDLSQVRDLEPFQKSVAELHNKINTNDGIVIMCSEKDPFSCHRFFLISYSLSILGIEIEHILKDGTSIPNSNLENELTKNNIPKEQTTLFDTDTSTITNSLENKYNKHGLKILNSSSVEKKLNIK